MTATLLGRQYERDTASGRLDNKGAENLTKPVIRAEIARREAALEEKTGVKAEAVVREYARIAFARIDEVLEVDQDAVRIRPFEELLEDVAPAIETIRKDTTDSGTRIEVKMHNKLQALDALAKHLGFFADKAASGPQVVIIHNSRGPARLHVHSREAQTDGCGEDAAAAQAHHEFLDAPKGVGAEGPTNR